MPPFEPESCQQEREMRWSGKQTNLSIYILEVCQSVLAIVRVSDIIVSDLMVTARRGEDTVHELSRGSNVIIAVLVIPFGRDLVRRIARREDFGYQQDQHQQWAETRRLVQQEGLHTVKAVVVATTNVNADGLLGATGQTRSMIERGRRLAIGFRLLCGWLPRLYGMRRGPLPGSAFGLVDGRIIGVVLTASFFVLSVFYLVGRLVLAILIVMVGGAFAFGSGGRIGGEFLWSFCDASRSTCR